MTAPARVTTLEGTRVGRYRLKRKIAQGGMASVYLGQLATGHGFEKAVAVKIMHPHLADNRRFVNMFLDEARLVARIHHPNVCSVLDFGEEQGLLYLVMEYLHGEPLSSVVRRGVRAGGLPRWLAARVVADTARGLHAAHEQAGRDGTSLHIVHRDVSPQNVHVLYDGIAKIVDFGVARARGRLTSTDSGEVKGKFAYMSPEQLRGEAVDRRTDVWAFGVVLWEATVGKRLFRGESQGETAVAVLQQDISRPSAVSPDYPPLLEQAVMGALDRDVSRRTPTAAALADGLELYLKQQPDLSGASQVQAFMHATFADRRELRDALLSSDDAGDRSPANVPFESQSSLGSLLDAEPSTTEEPPSSVRSTTARRPGARVRRRMAGLGAAALVLGVLGAGLWWSRADEEVPAPGGPAAEAPPAPASPEEAAPATADDAPRADPEVTGAGAAAEPPAAPAPSAEPEAPAATPRKHARSAPGTLNLLALPAAEVRWRGRSLGRTPLIDARLPAGRHTLTLRPLSGGPEEHITVVIRPGRSTRRSVRLGAP